jgi:HlyD family secretion protein
MKKFFVTAIVMSTLFISCTQKKVPLVTYQLSPTDYTEMIQTAGYILAVNSVSVMAPMEYYGNLSVAWVLPEGSIVEAGDTVCRLDCPPMFQVLDEQQRNLDNLRADLKKLEADNALNQAVLDARLKENLASMAISQLDSIQMRFAPPVKKQLMALELEKAKVEERKLHKKYTAEKSIDEAEIRQMKSRISQAENSVQSIQDKVKLLIVTAPTGGLLTHAEMRGRMMMMSMDGDVIEMGGYPKVGASIYPEMALMELPDLNEMQVKVEVQEVDYKRIEKGQKVEISVDAAEKLKTTGIVKRKSLAPQANYSSGSKLKLYEVIVSVDSLHTRMQPGLTAKCNIMINQVKDTVVVPTLAIYTRDSSKIVYVASGEKFRPVIVETGLSNSSQTLIIKGLDGKETIALVEPPQNDIEKPKNSTNE